MNIPEFNLLSFARQWPSELHALMQKEAVLCCDFILQIQIVGDHSTRLDAVGGYV